MSYYLYKHRSRLIVTCPRPNESFYFYLTFYPMFLGFSSFHRLDLLSSTSTPWVAVVLAYLPPRHRLARGEAPSSSARVTPDCHQSQKNRTIRFAKQDSPVFPVLSSSFRLLSDSCGNSFWRLRWGIDLLQPWLTMGWRSTTTTSCHPSIPTQRYDTRIICLLVILLIHHVGIILVE
jgi:hypothetical protein